MIALAEALQVCEVATDWKSITEVKWFNKKETKKERKVCKKLESI